MNRTLLSLIAVAAVALTSVASAPAAPALAAEPAKPAKPPPKAQRACFPARGVNNFAAVDDRNLYVRVGARDVYHLTMFGNCFDLSWVRALGLVSRGGSSFICEGSNADVEVVTHDAGMGPQRCPVSAVRKLTADETAALPKKARP